MNFHKSSRGLREHLTFPLLDWPNTNNCNGRKVYSPMVSFKIKVDSTVESGNLDKLVLGLTVIYALLHLNRLHQIHRILTQYKII